MSERALKHSKARNDEYPEALQPFFIWFIQSSFTCAIAGAIASAPLMHSRTFISHWLKSWIIAWATMIPFVLLATPLIRSAVEALTRERD
jgi:hypothetical protein